MPSKTTYIIIGAVAIAAVFLLFLFIVAIGLGVGLGVSLPRTFILPNNHKRLYSKS